MIPAETKEWQADAPVTLWRANLDVPDALAQRLTMGLSADELERGSRFHRPLDRARFLAARGWLRRLLAGQLGCGPGEVRIVTGPHGKPRLEHSELKFSAARSASVALFATSPKLEVGVDIEAIRPSADLDAIANRFFSTAEQRALESLPPSERVRAAFQCWTRKEAYTKGIGSGITIPLATVEVWAGGTERTVLAGWSVHQIEVGPDFAAALAGSDSADWIPNGPLELGFTQR